ncbi:hypothetical protein M1E09_07800 [Bacillus sp. AK031]
MTYSRFHACATCQHFSAERRHGKMHYQCKRLGFDTRPDYQFNCWTPKEHIKELMDKEGEEPHEEH